MTDTRQSIIRTTRNENLVLLMNMEKVAGHRSYTGVGGMDQKKVAQVPLRKCLLGFCGSYS